MCRNIRTSSQCMQHTKHCMCIKRYIMRQSIVEFNYIVYAEVQLKKRRKKPLPFQLHKTLSLVKLLHIVQDSMMKNLYPMPPKQPKCIQCAVAQAISESSHGVSIIAQLKTYIQKTTSFCLSTLALCSQICICSDSYPPESQGTELLFSCREQCVELQKLLHS